MVGLIKSLPPELLGGPEMASLQSQTPTGTDDSLQPITKNPEIGLTIIGRKEGKGFQTKQERNVHYSLQGLMCNKCGYYQKNTKPIRKIALKL